MASTNVMEILYGFFNGIKDSLSGLFKMFKMDEDVNMSQIKSTHKSDSTHKLPQMSILAKRRAERAGHDASANEKESSHPKVFPQIVKCCGLNGVICLAGTLLIYNVVIPGLKYLIFSVHGESWDSFEELLINLFHIFWIVPVTFVCKIVNTFFFMDIADAAYRKRCGRPHTTSFGHLVADMVYSIFLQILFMGQAMLIKYLVSMFQPFQHLDVFVYLLHMCPLYSVYAFEYKWFNMGWPVHKRLSFIESHLPYFFGFGLPLGLITIYPDSYFISLHVFAFLFPLLIVSANEADPICPFVDIPLSMFSLVCYISNFIFRVTIRKTPTSSSSTLPPGGSSSSSSNPVHKGILSKRVTLSSNIQEEY